MLLGGDERIDFLSQRGGFVDEFLGLVAVVPKGLRSHQRFEFGQSALSAGNVKETSATGSFFARRRQFSGESVQTWRRNITKHPWRIQQFRFEGRLPSGIVPSDSV